MKKTILITGASGYVGSKLLDNLKRNSNINIKTISTHTFDQNNLKFNDFINNNFHIDFFSGVDCVIHLASIAHQPKFNNREELYRVNVDYPVRLFEVSQVANIGKFIFISSAAVSLLDLGIVQDTIQYALTKQDAEKNLVKLNNEHRKTNLIILRPPMVYGDGAPGNYHRLLKMMEMPLLIPFGAMKFYKPTIHVDNLIAAIISITEKEIDSKYSNQTFEITDPFRLEFSDFLLKLKSSKKLKVIIFPLPLFILKLTLFLIGKSSLYNKLTLTYELSNTEFEKKYKWYPPRNEFNLFQE